MPRRRVLTGAQLESLLALPATEDDLVRQWTLSGDDLAAVGRRRRNHNQLGFALQLCVLRYPGRLLRPGELIPESEARPRRVVRRGLFLPVVQKSRNLRQAQRAVFGGLSRDRCRGERPPPEAVGGVR